MDSTSTTRLVFTNPRGNNTSNIVPYDLISNDREEANFSLADAFAPGENVFSKRVQFTLDKGMRGIIEHIQRRFKLGTLSGVFQLGLGLLHHLLKSDLEESELIIERSGTVVCRPNLVSVLLYTKALSDTNAGVDKYQIALDENQHRLLLDVQNKLGVNGLSDVARLAVMLLFAIAKQSKAGDSIVLAVGSDELELSV